MINCTQKPMKKHAQRKSCRGERGLKNNSRLYLKNLKNTKDENRTHISFFQND